MKKTCMLYIQVFITHYALSTFPERKQEVHTYIFLAPPFTLTFTDFTFEFQILFDLLWEWLTLFPKWAPFWHTAHLAMFCTSLNKLPFTSKAHWYKLTTCIFYQKFKQNARKIIKNVQKMQKKKNLVPFSLKRGYTVCIDSSKMGADVHRK